MVALIILVLVVINLILNIRLLKCGKFVHVEQKHIYIPAKKEPRKKVVEVEEYED